MQRCFISMTSLTYAQKAQKTLRKSGINTEIVRMPQKYAQNGCTFGLSFDHRQTAGHATYVLDMADIPYGKVILHE